MPALGFTPSPPSGGGAAFPIVTMPQIQGPRVSVGGSLAGSAMVQGIAEGESIGKSIGEIMKAFSPDAQKERELRERELILREKRAEAEIEALGTPEERAEARKMQREAAARAAREGERQERGATLAEKKSILQSEREEAAIEAKTHVRTADGRLITKEMDELEKMQQQIAIEAAKAARGDIPATRKLAELKRREDELKAQITVGELEKLAPKPTLGGDVPPPPEKGLTPIGPPLAGVTGEIAPSAGRQTLTGTPPPHGMLIGPDMGQDSFANKALANLPDDVKTTGTEGGAISAAQTTEKPVGRQPVTAGTQYDTKLTQEEEVSFKNWKATYAPKDSGADYDLRGAFKAGVTPDPETGHWPDTFKKPNHPTFSDQSKYATGANAAKAGTWRGEKFVPPAAGALAYDPAEEQRRKIAGLEPTEAAKRFEKSLESVSSILTTKYGLPPPATLEEGLKTLAVERAKEEKAKADEIAAKKEATKDKPAISSFKVQSELLSQKIGEMEEVMKTEGAGLLTFDRATVQKMRKLQKEIGELSQNVGRAVMGSTRPGGGGGDSGPKELPLSLTKEGEWLPSYTSDKAARQALEMIKDDLAEQIVAFGSVHGEYPTAINPEIAERAVKYAERTKRPVPYEVMRPVIGDLTEKLAASPDKRIQEVVKWLDENKDSDDPTLRNQMIMVARKLMNDTAAKAVKTTPTDEAVKGLQDIKEPKQSSGAH